MDSAQHRPYLQRLDHLRFHAAALVLLFHFFHSQLPDLKSGNVLVSLIDEGHSGIALFMVISGFIFTVLAGESRIDYGGFVRNRVLRIYPLFVFAVFLQLFIGAYNNHLNHGALQLLGWLIPFRADTVALSPQFAQLWTIWVEFQFYLIFPFLLLFTRSKGEKYLIAWLVLLCLTRLLVFSATGSVRYLAYETIFGRLDQFIVGMLLGRFWLRRHAPGLPPLQLSPLWLLAAGVAVLLGLHGFSRWCGYTDIDNPLWVVWPFIEGGLWGGWLWAYLGARSLFSGRLGVVLGGSLGRLGSISFSMYVMHNLIIQAWNAHLGLLPIGPAGFRVVATGLFGILPTVLAVSALTYWLIEQPFLAMRKPYLQAWREKTEKSLAAD